MQALVSTEKREMNVGEERGRGFALVVWVSRHPPIASQIDELKKKLGKIVLHRISGKIPNAEYIVDYVEKLIDTLHLHGAPVYIIPVLPLSMIAKLTELARQKGWNVLWAEMEQVKILDHEPKPLKDYDPTREVWIKGYENTYKIMRFKGFHRIKAVKLELEPF